MTVSDERHPHRCRRVGPPSRGPPGLSGEGTSAKSRGRGPNRPSTRTAESPTLTRKPSLATYVIRAGALVCAASAGATAAASRQDSATARVPLMATSRFVPVALSLAPASPAAARRHPPRTARARDGSESSRRGRLHHAAGPRHQGMETKPMSLPLAPAVPATCAATRRPARERAARPGRPGRGRRQSARVALPHQLPGLLHPRAQGGPLPLERGRLRWPGSSGTASGATVASGVTRDRVDGRLRLRRQLLPDRLLEPHRARGRPTAWWSTGAVRAVRHLRRQPLRRPGRRELRLLQGPPRRRDDLRPVPSTTGPAGASPRPSGSTPATRGPTRPTPPWPPGS